MGVNSFNGKGKVERGVGAPSGDLGNVIAWQPVPGILPRCLVDAIDAFLHLWVCVTDPNVIVRGWCLVVVRIHGMYGAEFVF